MVHEINDGRQEFAHIRFNVIRPGFQFRNPVRQVSGYNSVKTALFIGFVKAGKAFRKKAESTEDKDALGVHLFQPAGFFNHAFSGGYDVVYDDSVFSIHIIPQKFMGGGSGMGGEPVVKCSGIDFQHICK